ncbi:MAG TPA: endonuclease domain-containing protein [Gammaproteobacteria bacterium]|nr:endonuclease domain-containing protein [Gammaproteobacteria bacterium]
MEPYNKVLKQKSRQLRREMTDAEQLLWRHVRRRQIHGVQFNRQKPILGYIVDFYCARAKLVIELDGGQHFEPSHQSADRIRDQKLTQLGLLVLRYGNDQVLMETDAVIEDIYKVVEGRILSPLIKMGLEDTCQ